MVNTEAGGGGESAGFGRTATAQRLKYWRTRPALQMPQGVAPVPARGRATPRLCAGGGAVEPRTAIHASESVVGLNPRLFLACLVLLNHFIGNTCLGIFSYFWDLDA